MASEVIITPDAIDFHPAFPEPSLQQVVPFKVTVVRGRVRVLVSTPSAGVFSWNTMDETVTPLNAPRSVSVTFQPSDYAPVEAALIIDIRDLTAGGRSLAGFPRQLKLRGNTPGVGPGSLSVVSIVPDPPGGDLSEEVVFITNVSPHPLSMAGCSFGDMRFRESSGGLVASQPPERQLLPRGLFNSAFRTGPTLLPFASTGETLRVFTGRGPAAPTPPLKDIALNLRAPIWNNSGETAWIRNEYGQLIASLTYVAPASAGSQPSEERLVAAPVPSTRARRTFLLRTDVRWLNTGIPVEDGDTVSFFATGDIVVAWGSFQGTSTPAGRIHDSADCDWPLPGAPKYGLIGRFGAGEPFYIGGVLTRNVNGLGDVAPATLYLGLNDIKANDKWGTGYMCSVTVRRQVAVHEPLESARMVTERTTVDYRSRSASQ